MRAFPVPLALTAMALLTACGTSSTTILPTGSLGFVEPAGGESWAISDTVKISWACKSCTDVPSGDLVSVYADDGTTPYLIGQNLQMSDSMTWVVGMTQQSVSLLPGFFILEATDDAGDFRAQSRFFQVTAAP